MPEISLSIMTKGLARQFYSEFTLDPDLFLDKSLYKPFEYTPEFSDDRVDRYKAMGRVFLAVMLDDKPIGEIVLKEIDSARQCCTMGISMVNDAYKNKGYGTAAEQLAIRYAFQKLKLKTVFADTLITNIRSQHVLKKVGFREIRRNQEFIYYQIDAPDIGQPTLL